MRRTRDLFHATLTVLILIAASTAFAKTRVMRVLDWRNSLPGTSQTVSIEQDPEGFLWLSSATGVFRYDGTEMIRRSDPESGLVGGSATAGVPLLVRQLDDRLEVRQLDGSPVSGPENASLVSHVVVATDGALWVVDRNVVRRRARNGLWAAPIRLPPGAALYGGLAAGRDGTVFLLCGGAVYRADPGGRIEQVAAARGAIHALDRADGSTAIGCFVSGGGEVYEVRGGTTREIDRVGTRFMALAERAGVLWVAYDNQLVRLARGEPREAITTADGLPSGGAMLVDREGSLWVATLRGLAQFPEPDSVSWQPEAPVSGIHVIANRGEIWMSSWSGLFRARRGASGWTLTGVPGGHISAPCADRFGTVWAGAAGFPPAPAGEAPRPLLAGPFVVTLHCAESADGGIWLPAASGLSLLDPAQRTLRLMLPSDQDPGGFNVAYEDSRGTLWGARDGEACSTSAAAVRAGRPGPWVCSTLGHGRPVQTLREMPSGAIWATTFGAGVWRTREGHWEPLPVAADLVSSLTSGIVPSPSGGVWITGEGNFIRVRERTDLPEGWEVLERVGLWQGLPTSGISDVVEDADGALWAATNLSLVHIPPQARHARPEPPPVALVESAVDGRPLDVSPGHAIELPYRRNRLELRFAALSYREPNLIRYRTRLRPTEPWSIPTRQPFFRFVDLPPGRYQVEVEASLDGERWSRATRHVAFQVLRPWYRTWWFFSLLLVLIGTTLVLAYRLRVRALLRLERQRMRIAMDLHDEVGSGLGSIGVLAGILARPGLPEVQRADLSARVSGVARELSQSLGDIVWSLRAGSGNLDSLWVKVLDRARPLFASGSPLLRVEAPDPVPELPLSLAVRRNVSLIAIEALHNAARHASAANVKLALAVEREQFTIEIADDGNGFHGDAPGDATRRGLGLEGMRLRAEEMGGSVAWESPASGGTRVVIRFRAGRG